MIDYEKISKLLWDKVVKRGDVAKIAEEMQKNGRAMYSANFTAGELGIKLIKPEEYWYYPPEVKIHV